VCNRIKPTRELQIAAFTWMHPDVMLASADALFSEKMPQARQLNYVVRRQDRTDEIRLRRGVNLVQMTLRFGQLH
jgi:hypothetical protein